MNLANHLAIFNLQSLSRLILAFLLALVLTLAAVVEANAQPELVQDINPGLPDSDPQLMANVDGTVFFVADDGVHGMELWKSESTSAGAVLVKDIRPGPGGSTPGFLTNVGGTLFFAANDGAHGVELWRSDGTEAGTVMVKDINSGSSSSPQHLTNVDGTLFFSAHDGVTYGHELWKSDGTEAGTILVKDMGSSPSPTAFVGSTPNHLTNVDGTLFFSAFVWGVGRELWKSDGTEAGTVLVKNINGNFREDSSPEHLTNVNGTLFFSADGVGHSGVRRPELWKSDGTGAGTVLVKDIFPGSDGSFPNGSFPNRLTNVNGTLFFSADDGIHWEELWQSDGTEAGTVLVKDMKPCCASPTDSPHSSPAFLTNVGGTLFFSVRAGVPPGGSELWKSDGTEAGTVMVKDINPRVDSNGSAPEQLTNVDGVLFFNADDGVNGRELWQSDGTAAGTVMVMDIHSGANGATPLFLTNVDGTVFFSADDGVHGRELWKLGPASGPDTVTRSVAVSASSDDAYAGINPGWPGFSATGTGIYAGAPGSNGPVAGGWRFTGLDIPAGATITEAYVELNQQGWGYNVTTTLTFENSAAPDTFSADSTPAHRLGNSTAFSTSWTWGGPRSPGDWFQTPSLAVGLQELVDTHGAIQEVVVLEDGTGVPAGQYHTWASFDRGAAVVAKLVVTYSTDVTPPPTLESIAVAPASAEIELGQTQQFTATATYSDGSTRDVTAEATWTSSDDAVATVDGNGLATGEAEGTATITATLDGVQGTASLTVSEASGPPASEPVLVQDINPGLPDSDPQLMANVNGTVFFVADDGVHGMELWKSESTSAGAVLVKDIRPGSSGSNPGFLTNVGGNLFFAANDGSQGVELWRSDGTQAGTILVKDIFPGSDGSFPTVLTEVNGTLFFSANDGIENHGRELWKSDGTEAGTVLVKDIETFGPGLSNPRDLTNVGGVLFFSAFSNPKDKPDVFTYGRELWKSDGTEAGTVQVKDINHGSNSNPGSFTNVGGTLFFTADDGVHGWELWKSNGTEVGTVLVKDIWPGPDDSLAGGLTEVNGTLFFAAYDDAHGQELWQSDGTEGGTVLVKDIWPGVGDGTRPVMTNVAGTLFFPAHDGVHGFELWKSDGTEAGTILVKDISTSNASPSDHFAGSNPTFLTSVGGTLFFSASDRTHGPELWQSDGTEAGTALVKDINSSGGSSPERLTNVDGTLFFSADDGVHGRELWKFTPASSPSPEPPPSGPFTFTVITTNGEDVNPGDGQCADAQGQCTLQAAVQEANALDADVTIILPAGTYGPDFMMWQQTEDYGFRLLIQPGGSVRMVGDGAGQTVVQGGAVPGARTGAGLLLVAQGAVVELQGVTVKGAPGIDNSGTLLLEDSNLEGGGHAIGNRGTATLRNVAVQQNSELGISNHGTMTIEDSQVRENNLCGSSAGCHRLGPSAINSSGPLTIERSVIENHSSTGSPIIAGGDTVIRSSVIRSNAGSGTGGISVGANTKFELIDSIVENNKGGTGGIEGGTGASITLENSIVRGNQGGNTGGIHMREGVHVILHGSSVINNTPTDCNQPVTEADAASQDSDGTCIPENGPPPPSGGLPINPGDTWRYFKGTSEPPANWKEVNFNDSAWSSGPSGFGYGDGDDATVLTDMPGKYVAVFIRKTFTISDPSGITELVLTMDYDDAFVAYINGAEVARANIFDNPARYHYRAYLEHEASGGDTSPQPVETFDLSSSIDLLVAGTNVLAIQGHNKHVSSSDFTLIPALYGN